MDESYAEYVRPEGLDETEQINFTHLQHTKTLPLEFEPNVLDGRNSLMTPPTKGDSSHRKFRLSRSPLDSLQAEFRRYNIPDRSSKPELLQPRGLSGDSIDPLQHERSESSQQIGELGYSIARPLPQRFLNPSSSFRSTMEGSMAGGPNEDGFSHLLCLQRKQNSPPFHGPIDELDSQESNGSTVIHVDDLENPDSVSAIPDWSFVQRKFELPNCPRSSDCPSLATGSTISSRNSSTRSTRSFRWDGVEQFKNETAPTHIIIPTHDAERPEKCPVPTCYYHTKGFAYQFDMVRHSITHWKGSLTCGFCTNAKRPAEVFSRCDVFLRHLVSVHGAEQDAYPRREESCRAGSSKHSPLLLESQGVATCGLCTEPLGLQGFYEHLRGCVLRQVTRACATLQLEQAEPTPCAPAPRDETRDSSTSCSVPSPVESEHAGKGNGETASCQESSETKGVGRWGKEKRAEDKRRQAIRGWSAASLRDRLSSPPHGDELCARDVHRTPNNRTQKQLEAETEDSSQESRDIAELTASSRCLSLTSSQDEGIKSSDEETDWTEDVGSPQSEPDASGVPPMLSPIKRQLVESIMREFHRIFDTSLRTCNGGRSASSGSGHGYYSGSSGSSTYSTSSFISRKRSLSGGSTPPPNDEDDSHKRRRPDPKSSIKPAPELRFACPYYKRNPGRHQTFTSCRDPGFITVARLKEHLYRRHLLPIQCNRCCATFPNEPTLREHQRDPRGCEVREQMPLEGFDKDQERKLKSKKRSLVYQSEEDKWKGVYRVLFPDDAEADMPSPYIEYQPCNMGAQPGEPASNVARFQEFSRLELPRLVRRTLEVAVEQEAQPLEDKLKERLVDIVRDCQSQLVSMFQSTLAAPSTPSSAPPLARPLAHEATPPPNTSAQPSQLPTTSAAPFLGFDSHTPSTASFIPIPATTAPPLSPPSLALPKPDSSPLEPTSGSPDSGYDSTRAGFPMQEPSFVPELVYGEAAPAFVPQPSYPVPTASYSEADYIDLGGYYGLFQERGPELSGVGMEAQWAYVDPSANGSSNGMMGLGTGTGA